MTLDDMWNSYSTRVLPPNAGAVQVEETQKAFYAGAYSILTQMVQGASDGEEVTDGDLDMVGGFFNECEAFLASKIKGHEA